MKILCLSDLHRHENSRDFIKQNKWLENLWKQYQPDIVVITGDVYEYDSNLNPYSDLHKVLRGSSQPILCTLGNHEFAFNTTEKTLLKYKGLYEPNIYNVHYLDVISFYDYEDKHFIGNFLGYDGSMKDYQDQKITDWANMKWFDQYIVDWDREWLSYCKKCQEEIKFHMAEDGRLNILCTHTVPHWELNMHDRPSPFNAFSGVSNFLEQYEFDYAICGHTHKRTIGKCINGCYCVNTGSHYGTDWKMFLLEI